MAEPEIEYFNSMYQEWRVSDGLSWEDAIRVNELVGWEMYRKVE